jgi:hypothetical protein
MYQGRQDLFTGPGETTCNGTVAFAALRGMEAMPVLCFARYDGELVCDGTIAGRTYDVDTPAGVSDVVQLLAAGFNEMCALSRDGTAWCAGFDNMRGKLATGDVFGLMAFSRWGGPMAEEIGVVVAIGTNEQSICALNDDGALYCSGASMGAGTSDALLPEMIAVDVSAFHFDGIQQALRYQTTGGSGFVYAAQTDETTETPFTVCRVSAGLAEYLVTEPGIVDGIWLGAPMLPESALCVLGESGILECDSGARFGSATVLAFAAKTEMAEPAVFGIRPDGAVVNETGAELHGPGSARVPECN